MSIDQWELMAAEFDKLLKEASDNGMSMTEFHQRWARLQWEWEESEKSKKDKSDEKENNL